MSIESRELNNNIGINDECLLTFLFPICEWYPMFKDSLMSILNDYTDDNFEILVVFDSLDTVRNNNIIKVIDEMKSNKIRMHMCEGEESKNSLYNKGFYCAKGKWLSLVENNYIFLSGSIKKIVNLLMSIDKLDSNISYISLHFFNLRIQYEDSNQLKREIDHLLSRDDSDYSKFNLMELNDKNLKNYGGFGINVPQRGSLYLRKAFSMTKGFVGENYPLENRILVKEMENGKEYKTYLSLIPYGVYVSMDSMFGTKKNVIKAYNIWTEYLRARVDSIYLLNCTKKTKEMYLNYKLIQSLISRHKSLDLKYEDFDVNEFDKPNIKWFIISYIISNWNYTRWRNRQFDINERKIK